MSTAGRRDRDEGPDGEDRGDACATATGGVVAEPGKVSSCSPPVLVWRWGDADDRDRPGWRQGWAKMRSDA